jgi:hypothetical protein
MKKLAKYTTIAAYYYVIYFDTQEEMEHSPRGEQRSMDSFCH